MEEKKTREHLMSAAYTAGVLGVVFLYFFSLIVLYQGSLLVYFHPCLVFVHLQVKFSLLGMNFSTIFPLSFHFFLGGGGSYKLISKYIAPILRYFIWSMPLTSKFYLIKTKRLQLQHPQDILSSVGSMYIRNDIQHTQSSMFQLFKGLPQEPMCLKRRRQYVLDVHCDVHGHIESNKIVTVKRKQPTHEHDWIKLMCLSLAKSTFCFGEGCV